MRCGKRYGPGGVWALGGGEAIGMHGERARLKAVCGGQGTRGAHSEHDEHGRDLGRVEEAERLWLNADACCRIERGGHTSGAANQGWGGQGTRGAHHEHPAHVRDAVDVSQLEMSALNCCQ